jgi:GLPGLI family protein
MIFTKLDAQLLEKPFVIEYKSGYLALTDSLQVKLLIKPKKYHPLKDYEIIVTGDIAFVNFIESARDKNAKKLGTNFRHDNVFSDFSLQKEYHQIQRHELNNQRLLVERNFPALQFDLYQDSVKILGYTCYKAMPARNNYLNAVVWYTPQIPYPISKHGFTGLPGAILAMESFSHGIRYVSIASSIRPESRVPKKPTKGYPITGKEYVEMLNKVIPESVRASFTNQ